MERPEAAETEWRGFGLSSLLTSRLECDPDTGEEKMGGDGRTPEWRGWENVLLNLPGTWRRTDDVVANDAADGVRTAQARGARVGGA